jgi:predicted RNase H-like HicB family nuclease
MIDLPYSLVIEATEEPDFFGFFSEELEGFSGMGYSVEDCLYRAKWAMKEHVELLTEQGLPIPPRKPEPIVTIRNERMLRDPLIRISSDFLATRSLDRPP